jgi:hypothetical protein
VRLSVEEDRGGELAIAPQRRAFLAAPRRPHQFEDFILDQLVGGPRDGAADLRENALPDLMPQIQKRADYGDDGETWAS